MSLYVYDKMQENTITDNSAFFNLYNKLHDTPIVKAILQTIDGAIRVDDRTFISKFTHTPVDQQFLSDGAKTLLNVAAYPDKCFSAIECGENALIFLSNIHDGSVVWPERAAWIEDGSDIECDIMYHGIHFTSYKAFQLCFYYGEEFYEDYLD